VEELNKAFDAALDAGYRLFDTAALYNNEAIIGDFFEEKFKQGNLKRSDIFITTKVKFELSKIFWLYFPKSMPHTKISIMLRLL
jgi:diketogulonate reductase-like aldo/keto reductase